MAKPYPKTPTEKEWRQRMLEDWEAQQAEGIASQAAAIQNPANNIPAVERSRLLNALAERARNVGYEPEAVGIGDRQIHTDEELAIENGQNDLAKKALGPVSGSPSSRTMLSMSGGMGLMPAVGYNPAEQKAQEISALKKSLEKFNTESKAEVDQAAVADAAQKGEGLQSFYSPSQEQQQTQEQEQSGAGLNIPLTQRLFGGGSQKISAELGKQEGLAALGQLTSLAQQATENKKQQQKDITELFGKQKDVVDGWISTGESAVAKYGQAAKGLENKYNKAAKEADDAYNEFKKTGINATRLINTLPTWAKVLTMMTVGFETVASGMAGKKSIGLSVLNQAIARDIAAQRANIKNLLDKANLANSQKESIWNKWNAIETKLENATQRLTQLQLSKFGLQTKSLEAQNNAADQIIAIGQNLVSNRVNIQKAIRGKTTTTSLWKDVQTNPGTIKALLGGSQGGKELPPKVKENLSAAADSAEVIKNYFNDVTALSGEGIGKRAIATAKGHFLPGSKEFALQNMRGTIAVHMAKVANGGRPSYQEVPFFMHDMPSVWDPPETRQYKFNMLRKRAWSKFKSTLALFNKNNWNTADAERMMVETFGPNPNAEGSQSADSSVASSMGGGKL